MSRLARGFLGAFLAIAAATADGGEGKPPEWVDCLASQPRAAWPASGGAQCRLAEGTLELRTEATGDRATVALVPPRYAAFDLDVELRWSRRGVREGGGVEIVAGPHGFGSFGYRVVVTQAPWQVAEARAPRLTPDAWHPLELRVRPGRLEYWLDGRPMVSCPAETAQVGGARLVISPGTQALLRRCRFRDYGSADTDGRAPELPRFVYPASASRHEGRRVPDGAAGGRAIEAAGAGRDRWLVRGQDGSLGPGGAYVATFDLRAVEGAGDVWLEVARSEGGVLASKRVRLEELPARGYARVALPFRSEAGWMLEYRVAAESGRLRVDDVAVSGDGGPRPPPAGAAQKPRRALPLPAAWGRAPQEGRATRGLSIVDLERRLAGEGWYEFRVVWRQDAAAPADDVAVDIWVACRDAWGIVRAFDYGAAYDAVRSGRHETSAWMAPALPQRYGPPVSFFAQLYRRGEPVASAWRKWGIPVDDKYIIEAPATGRLRAAGPTE